MSRTLEIFKQKLKHIKISNSTASACQILKRNRKSHTNIKEAQIVGIPSDENKE